MILAISIARKADSLELGVPTDPRSTRLRVHHDGRVWIEIYRLEDEQLWTLEVVAEDRTSTVWDDTFESDQTAFDEAIPAVNKEGARAQLGRRSGDLTETVG